MNSLLRAGGYFLSYAVWTVLFRLFVLTLVTSLLMSSSAKLEEISEIFHAHEMIVAGASAALYTLLLYRLYPLSSVRDEPLWIKDLIKSQFFPSLVRGAALAFGLCLAFILSNQYQYVGFFYQTENSMAAFGALLIRALAIVCMVYLEEFLFRYKLITRLREEVPPVVTILFTSLLFCSIKWVQFDSNWPTTLSLLLISLIFSIHTLAGRSYVQGAGFLSGLLFMTHVILGLPLFEIEFRSFFLIQYGGSNSSLLSPDQKFAEFLTGGAHGLFASGVLQIILCLQLIKSVFRNKKLLFSSRATR